MKTLLTLTAALMLGLMTFVVALQVFQENEPPHGDPVLVVYHADWCGPCRAFEGTLADPEVKATLAASGIEVRSVDVERGQSPRWGYDGGGIPAFALVYGDRVVRVHHGYLPPRQFQSWVTGK